MERAEPLGSRGTKEAVYHATPSPANRGAPVDIPRRRREHHRYRNPIPLPRGSVPYLFNMGDGDGRPRSTPPMEPTPSPSTTDGYEFSPEQNALILRLASRMQFVGLFALGLGVVSIIAGAVQKHYGVLFGGI